MAINSKQQKLPAIVHYNRMAAAIRRKAEAEYKYSIRHAHKYYTNSAVIKSAVKTCRDDLKACRNLALLLSKGCINEAVKVYKTLDPMVSLGLPAKVERFLSTRSLS